MKRVYFVTEGPHDVEVIGRIVSRHGCRRVRKLEELDSYWNVVVPRTFPSRGDLLKRVPVPVFFASEQHSVAVQCAENADKIPDMIRATLTTLETSPNSVGIVLDADFKFSAAQRWNSIAQPLEKMLPDVGSGPGAIGDGIPRAGIYVLPDNSSPGTLEDVLLECASKAYPSLLARARAFIDPIEHTNASIFRNAEERSDFRKPAGKKKALIGCIGSVLRPGKAIQVSLQDNLWLKDAQALQTPCAQLLVRFIDGLVA